MTLERLPLQPGYYRASARSSDVRRCPDAVAAECTEREAARRPECAANRRSGCKGGDDPNEQCVDGLSGIYCGLCRNTSGHYYAAASHDTPSRCAACTGPAMVERW